MVAAQSTQTVTYAIRARPRPGRCQPASAALRSMSTELRAAAGRDSELLVAGGLGGQTTVTLPVTAGQVVQVNVGGAGANGNSAGCSIGYPMKVSCGGFNGAPPPAWAAPTLRTTRVAAEAAHPTFGLAHSAWTSGWWWPAVAPAADSVTGAPVSAGGSSGTAGADAPACTPPACSPLVAPHHAGRGGAQTAGGVGGAARCASRSTSARPEPKALVVLPNSGVVAVAADTSGGGGGSDCAIGTAGGGGSGYSSGPGAVSMPVSAVAMVRSRSPSPARQH